MAHQGNGESVPDNSPRYVEIDKLPEGGTVVVDTQGGEFDFENVHHGAQGFVRAIVNRSGDGPVYRDKGVSLTPSRFVSGAEYLLKGSVSVANGHRSNPRAGFFRQGFGMWLFGPLNLDGYKPEDVYTSGVTRWNY